ncbi:unnamed protein product [Lasius platythorax]|uniref:Uncharacterized protein n=1 Tax=Lasius platythorax TaxID=488582 RepID=A0AAV2MXT9_9HYME
MTFLLDLTRSTCTLRVGRELWDTLYNHIVREKEPSSFITNMSYAVWGPEVLASRCVRSQANVVEQELTPTKKFAVINEFEKWMRIKRKMPQMLIDEQLDRSKINKYFNGAITAARKKTNYNIKEKMIPKKTVKSKRAEKAERKPNQKHRLDSRTKNLKTKEEGTSDETSEEKLMSDSDDESS